MWVDPEVVGVGWGMGSETERDMKSTGARAAVDFYREGWETDNPPEWPKSYIRPPFPGLDEIERP